MRHIRHFWYTDGDFFLGTDALGGAAILIPASFDNILSAGGLEDSGRGDIPIGDWGRIFTEGVTWDSLTLIAMLVKVVVQGYGSKGNWGTVEQEMRGDWKVATGSRWGRPLSCCGSWFKIFLIQTGSG